MTEDQLDERHDTKSRLASGGDYGLGCLVFEGDVVDDAAGWLGDEHYRAVRGGHEDIGTIAIVGDLTVDGDIYLSDRLYCLVVMGRLTAVGEVGPGRGAPLDLIAANLHSATRCVTPNAWHRSSTRGSSRRSSAR